MAGWGGGYYTIHVYLLYICYSKLLGSHNDVSVLSKSVMGLKKSFDRGVGGWGELYSFFWNVFNFANPLPQYVVNISQW